MMVEPVNFDHGDDRWRYQQAIVADFSSNTWYLGPSVHLLDHLKSELNTIEHYPPEVLTKAYPQADLVMSLFCNGSTEAIYLLAQLFQQRQSLIFSPTFSEYERACTIHRHQIRFHKWNELRSIPSSDQSVWWLCNPVNPTGAIHSPDLIEELLNDHPQSIFIIDEAYHSLAEGFTSVLDLISRYQNLIVIRSLTKSMAIPGLRVGYLSANLPVIKQLQSIRQPWAFNTLALKAFEYSSYNSIITPGAFTKYMYLKDQLQQQLNKLKGFEALPSSTGFFLLRTPFQASWLKQELVSQFRILVRDASNFRYLDANTVRIATRTQKENGLLVNALSQLISNDA